MMKIKSLLKIEKDTAMRLQMMRQIYALLLMPCIVLAQPARAENIKIVSMVLGEGLQMEDQSGFYADLMTEILKVSKVPADFSIVPFKRALARFSSNEDDCIWATDVELLSKLYGWEEDHLEELIESSLVFDSQQYLFSTSGSTQFKSFSDVEGAVIGVLNGGTSEAIYGKYTPDFVTLPSQEAKIKMLLAGRLDAIGGWVPDIYITLQYLGVNPDQIKKTFELNSTGTRVVCHKSAHTETFLNEINDAISTFVGSQRYADIYLEYNIPINLE